MQPVSRHWGLHQLKNECCLLKNWRPILSTTSLDGNESVSWLSIMSFFCARNMFFFCVRHLLSLSVTYPPRRYYQQRLQQASTPAPLVRRCGAGLDTEPAPGSTPPSKLHGIPVNVQRENLIPGLQRSCSASLSLSLSS